MLHKRNFSRWAALSLLMLLSCNVQQPAEFFSQPDVALDLDAIKKRGYINALVDNNSVSYFIYKGQPMGYEYELLQLLAKDLGVGLKIKVTSGVGPAIKALNNGDGDIIAFPLTITKTRRNMVAFSRPHFNTYQVLVQRKPSNWRRLTVDEIENNLVRNPAELIGKEVHVIDGTSYELRLKHLSEELGGDIIIRKDTLTAESESLIRKVAMGQINYTLADHTLARVNAAYYPNIDVNTVLSVPQQIAWAVRSNSPELLKATDNWLGRIKAQPTFMVIYNRYFKSPRTSAGRMKSDYASINGSKLSPYDELFKAEAQRIGWDWRLLAALVYQESKFLPAGESWAGATGLMQLMPETAKRFGASNPNDPAQSMHAGARYLQYLDRYWSKSIVDADERLKFVLASYNAGLSHIIDARKLCIKYNRNPMLWEDVSYFLLKKADARYYRDPLVKAGYCKCEEPVNYVVDVLERFDMYKTHIKSPLTDERAVQSSTAAR